MTRGERAVVACIDPCALAPGDLMAYADGDARAHVAAHVARCPACAAEAAALRRASRRLAQALLRFTCPSPQTLGQYHLDLLSPEARTRIAAHALECHHCAAEL
jgi:anti-sigma factor RsiW